MFMNRVVTSCEDWLFVEAKSADETITAAEVWRGLIPCDCRVESGYECDGRLIGVVGGRRQELLSEGGCNWDGLMRVASALTSSRFGLHFHLAGFKASVV